MFNLLLVGCYILQTSGYAFAQQQVFDANIVAKRAITPEVEKLVGKLLNEADIPGLSLGVVHGDEVELGAWGVKTEDGANMTADTLFGIASCSKAFLASSVGILMDDFAHGRNVTPLPAGLNRFDWYTPVKDLLPGDWQLMDESASEHAQMRDILSHQSGVPRHEFSYKPTDKAIDIVRRMRYLRPAFQLRQRYHYNNQMYALGSHLVATYSGMSYADFVKARIWDRLYMSDSTFHPDVAVASGKLTQAWYQGARRIPFWDREELVEVNGGPGAIITSASDLTKWIKTWLNEGVDPLTNETIIPSATFEEMTTAKTLTDGRATEPYFSIRGYGMGWSRSSYQGHEYIEHGGAIPGFSAEILIFPADKIGIVVLANTDGKHAQENAIAYRVVEDLLGLPHKASEKLASQTALSSSPKPAAEDAESKAASTLPFALSTYVGTYHDIGYGNLTVCAPTEHPSAECAPVLSAFTPFDDFSDSSVPPTLYLSISSIWISHLRLRHLHDNTFYLLGSWLFPNGYGKNTTAFDMLVDGGTSLTAEFVFGENGDVSGLAINGFVGETTVLQRKGGSVKDTSEVWLDRIV